jgi:amino acid transporter
MHLLGQAVYVHHIFCLLRRNTYQKSIQNGNAWSNALIKVIFAFGGYNNANNLVNEIPNPVRTLKVYSNVALGIVSILYMLSAVAFFA